MADMRSRLPRRGSEPVPDAIDRRSFVVTGAFALTALGVPAWLVAPAQAETAAPESFRNLSAFLIGDKDVDPVLAERAFGQLAALDAGFPEKAAALAAVVDGSQAPTVDDFLAHPASSDLDLRTTMTTVVSAWYLGYTGTLVPLRAVDDTGFVTFVGARMYEPTMDATVRPTYARAGLNYWIDPPPFVTPPPAPPGIASWGQELPQGIGVIPGSTAPASEEPEATAPTTPEP